MPELIEDKKWVKNSLMLPHHDIDDLFSRRKVFSSAFMKFTDTTPGGNQVMNPPPQFTRHADLKAGMEHSLRPGQSNKPYSRGMGRRYSEVIDDNSQVIHLRFGVPQFNSLHRFFNHSFDWSAARLSRTGREPGFFYSLGKVTGYVVTLPIQPLILAGTIYRFLSNKPSTKFYYIKPTMPLYWNAVNSMANSIAVYMGIVPRVLANDNNAETDEYTSERMETYNEGTIMEDQDEYSDEELKKFHDLLPRIFRESGGVDVYAVSTRAQRIANASQNRLKESLEAEDSGFFSRTRDRVSDFLATIPNTRDEGVQYPDQDEDDEPGFQAYLSAWQRQSNLSKDEGDPDENTVARDSAEENQGFWSELVDFFKAELNDGGQFVSFRVNHVGSISESFSNSVQESDIAQKLNGTSAQARSKRFSFADGNITDAAGIGSAIQGVSSAIQDFAAGALETINLDGLMAFAGNAYTSIPKVWHDSSANLPQANYRIELRTPYGNKMSRFLNLYMPLCMLLAGALPKSVGHHSYDAPFLVEIYDRGRKQVRLGMIDQISITRGVGNVGWTQEHAPLGIDVDFSVVDLETAVHVPINPSPGLFDEDNPYNDYLATLGGLTLADQVYQWRKLKINMTRKIDTFRQYKSPAKWSTLTAGALSGRALGRITRYEG